MRASLVSWKELTERIRTPFCRFNNSILTAVNEILSKITISEANVLILFFLGIFILILISKRMLKKKSPAYLKLISLYIFLMILQIAFGLYFIFANSHHRGKQSPINVSGYIFIVFEYGMFAILLSNFIKLIIIKKYLLYSCILFPLIAIAIWFLIPSFARVVSVLNAIESISLIPFCLYYFFELLRNPTSVRLTEQPSFWITTGILFLFICITPYYIAYDYFKKVPQMQIIDYIGYDLLVLFLAKGSFINSQRNG